MTIKLDIKKVTNTEENPYLGPGEYEVTASGNGVETKFTIVGNRELVHTFKYDPESGEGAIISNGHSYPFDLLVPYPEKGAVTRSDGPFMDHSASLMSL